MQQKKIVILESNKETAQETADFFSVAVEEDEGREGRYLQFLGQFHALAFFHVNLDGDEARVHVRADFLLRKHGVRHHLARPAPRGVAVQEYHLSRLLRLGHGVLEERAFGEEGDAFVLCPDLQSETENEERK